MSARNIFAALLLAATSLVANADTIGVHLYTHHVAGTQTDERRSDFGQPLKYQNNTYGLYYVKDSGTPVLGDNAIFGVFCNSYSLPQYNDVNEIQQKSCNVTYELGKSWTVVDGGWYDVRANVTAFVGYKKNRQQITINSRWLKADVVAAPSLSLRVGPVRITALDTMTFHVSVEHQF